jgi:SAM-dependent methyltransferase
MSNELANALRFNGRVQDYERFRMRYPVDVLDVIREHCGLTPKYQVADIGAGTGMLAELFLDFGCPVTAVEPNAEMRAACQPLQHRFRTMQMVDATAEATTLAVASFDLVCVGRAFHWFDADRALSEFRRILRPGRWVTLVSNRRAQLGSEAATDYEQILMQHAIDYSALRGGYRRFETLDPFPGQSRRSRSRPFWARHSHSPSHRCPATATTRPCRPHCTITSRAGAATAPCSLRPCAKSSAGRHRSLQKRHRPGRRRSLCCHPV